VAKQKQALFEKAIALFINRKPQRNVSHSGTKEPKQNCRNAIKLYINDQQGRTLLDSFLSNNIRWKQ